jgi:PAS domain S-box-containing protein
MREEIRNARSFFANLIQNSVECVIAADMQGTIILFNDGAERLLGHCARDVIGKLHITRIYKDPARAHEVMKLLRRSDHGGTGRLDDTVQVAVSAAGEEIPVRIRAAIIYQDGKEVATVGYFHDMRERLSMERQLRETQTQLLQAEKMSSLGKLAAGIAHQINNPLAGIMLAGHLLQERHGVDPDAREELESIIENANRCREIVKDLLGFARQTRRQVAPMDLNRALERTLFLLVNQPLFHNIRIERRLQPDLPALQADEQQLNQVFMNLILNAAEAMGGRGTLAVRTRRADEDLVEFEIEDTGCGIRPEVLSHIFEPFFTTKPPGKGTGLGLSVAYGIVAQHGGAIDVRSREGLGTTFCVRLPLRPGVTEEPPP